MIDWSCLEKWLKESTCFFNTTQKIEIFGCQKIELFPKNYDSKNWTFFSQKKDAKIFFFKKSDSKNGSFLKIWLIELNFSNKTWLKELNPFVPWLRELIFLRLKELNFFCLVWVKELVFS